MDERENPLYRIVKGKLYIVTVTILIISVIVYIETDSQTSYYIKVINIMSAALIPACLVGLIWEFFMKNEFLEYVMERLSINNVLNRSGIVNIYSYRNDADFIQFLRKARKRIWIQVTSFSYLTETPKVLDVLKSKSSQGVDLCILGLAPDTESAKLRSAFSSRYQNLNQEIPGYIKTLVSEFKTINSSSSQPEIFLYDKIPTTACFLVDSNILFCPLLCHKRGRDSSHILVSKSESANAQNQLFEEYEGHLRKLINETQRFYPKEP